MIKDILKKQVIFEGVSDLDKFHEIFTSLYNISLFKNGLDLVLTRMQEGNLHFEIKINLDLQEHIPKAECTNQVIKTRIKQITIDYLSNS